VPPIVPTLLAGAQLIREQRQRRRAEAARRLEATLAQVRMIQNPYLQQQAMSRLLQDPEVQRSLRVLGVPEAAISTVRESLVQGMKPPIELLRERGLAGLPPLEQYRRVLLEHPEVAAQPGFMQRLRFLAEAETTRRGQQLQAQVAIQRIMADYYADMRRELRQATEMMLEHTRRMSEAETEAQFNLLRQAGREGAKLLPQGLRESFEAILDQATFVRRHDYARILPALLGFARIATPEGRRFLRGFAREQLGIDLPFLELVFTEYEGMLEPTELASLVLNAQRVIEGKASIDEFARSISRRVPPNFAISMVNLLVNLRQEARAQKALQLDVVFRHLGAIEDDIDDLQELLRELDLPRQRQEFLSLAERVVRTYVDVLTSIGTMGDEERRAVESIRAYLQDLLERARQKIQDAIEFRLKAGELAIVLRRTRYEVLKYAARLAGIREDLMEAWLVPPIGRLMDIESTTGVKAAEVPYIELPMPEPGIWGAAERQAWLTRFLMETHADRVKEQKWRPELMKARVEAIRRRPAVERREELERTRERARGRVRDVLNDIHELRGQLEARGILPKDADRVIGRLEADYGRAKTVRDFENLEKRARGYRGRLRTILEEAERQPSPFGPWGFREGGD